jgi:hypothetical protein
MYTHAHHCLFPRLPNAPASAQIFAADAPAMTTWAAVPLLILQFVWAPKHKQQ